MKALAALACVAACTHARPAPRPVAPAATDWPSPGVDWTRPPPVAPAPPVRDRPIVETQLANGIRLVTVEDDRIPIVTVVTMHHAAGSREDGAHPGLAALTADLLDEGTELARSADLVAGNLQRNGARLEIDIASDYASTHLTVAADHLAGALVHLADVLRRPRLLDRDLRRLRAARTAELAAEVNEPRTVAARAFDRLIFGAHPYALPAEGTAASVAAITAPEVRAFYERAYGPATTTIIVVGAIAPAAAQQAIDRAFGDWAVLQPPPPPPPHAPPPPAPVLGFVDRPGAREAAIVVGNQVDIATGDRLASDVANAVLGGGPGARLDAALRGALHVTSGVAASFWRGQLGSAWSVITSTPTADAPRALRTILALVEDARTHDASAAEVARAKAQLARGVAGVYDTTAATARSLERLVAQERALTFAGFAERIAAVTPTAARAAVDRAWARPSVVVAGDWAVLGKELSALGLAVVQLRE